MAKLVYDESGRLLFTKEMKEEYTLLMPQMLPVHFGMMQKLLECEGFKVDMLTTCLLYTSIYLRSYALSHIALLHCSLAACKAYYGTRLFQSFLQCAFRCSRSIPERQR